MARPESRIFEEPPPLGEGDSKELKAAKKRVAAAKQRLAEAEEQVHELEIKEKGR